MESIYAYTDYRRFLKDYFVEKKAQNRKFSLKTIADRAGFKARDFILRIMNGTRNLSQSGAFKLSEALQLSQKETEYFITLVAFNQADTPREKDFFYNRLSEICRYGRLQKIRSDQCAYFSEWFYSALRSLLPVIDFRDDFAAIGKFLTPNLTAAEVEKAVRFLLELGLMEKDEEGRYHVANAQLEAAEAVKSVALVRFHKQSLDLARRAIDLCKPESRDITGVTMSLSREGYSKIREELGLFRKRAMHIATNDRNEDTVYQLNMQLFPLSKRKKT